MSDIAETYFERDVGDFGRVLLFRNGGDRYVTLAVDDGDYAPGSKHVHVTRADLQALLDAYPTGDAA